MSRYHCHTNNVCSHGVYESNDEVPWVCAVQNSSSNPFCVVSSACLSGWSSVAKGQSATAITALLKNGHACTQIALGPPLNATRIRETIMKQHWRSKNQQLSYTDDDDNNKKNNIKGEPKWRCKLVWKPRKCAHTFICRLCLVVLSTFIQNGKEAIVLHPIRAPWGQPCWLTL